MDEKIPSVLIKISSMNILRRLSIIARSSFVFQKAVKVEAARRKPSNETDKEANRCRCSLACVAEAFAASFNVFKHSLVDFLTQTHMP